MDFFTILSKYFWIMFILVTFVNAIIMKIRSKERIAQDPLLEPGYDTIFKGFITWGNIPWIVMGTGILTGKVPTIWHYFRPQDENPFVIAWFISLFVIWIIGTYWIFMRNGAEMLGTHPGLFTVKPTSPIFIKLYWGLCIVGGIAGTTMMFVMDIPIPNFR